MTGILDRRLKLILPSIIGQTQKGFLKERFIGENTRLVYDIMDYLNSNNMAGMLLLVDFEKAFDTLEWSYIKAVLNKYNFGNTFTRWFDIIYKNSNSCVINNGKISESFELGRGCRQGDPLSPYLFILAIEPLAKSIQNNKDIKGILIREEEYKIGQYADDTFCLLDGSKKSLKTVLEIFKMFALCSGLKINIDKTKVVWLGNKAGSQDRICAEFSLNWEERFTLLGIQFSVRKYEMELLNYQSKLTEIKKVINAYGKRNLTLLGRATVVKTLIIPKMIHIFAVLPSPNSNIMKEIKHAIKHFIWRQRTPAVSEIQMAQEIENGGIKLTALEPFIRAVKLSWIKRLYTTEGSWQTLFFQVININKTVPIWELDPRSLINMASKTINTFWKEMFQIWAKTIQYKWDNNIESIPRTPIWNYYTDNSNNLRLYQKRFSERGCIYIKDIINYDTNKF